MKKIINLCKNSASCSILELRNYKIMVLNIGQVLIPSLKARAYKPV